LLVDDDVRIKSVDDEQPPAYTSPTRARAYLKVSACCKHADVYNVEEYRGVTRHELDVHVSPRDLADTYLPAFESCVADAGATCVMCSYNAVNGVPSCASHSLLTKTIRGRLGFTGYVTSDCGAVADILNNHHYTNR
jgi:beta-glucosidase-like glycosyl hydrolase